MLDTTLGGPDIDLAQGLVSNRRSLYFTHHGESRMPFLEVFDAADACDAYRRSTSVVPQQALALVNNDFLVGLSQTLADKLWAEGQAGSPGPEMQSERFITASFESVLSRRPKPAELNMAREFLASQRSIIQAETPGGGAEALARRDLVHALFSHNDFLTIH